LLSLSPSLPASLPPSLPLSLPLSPSISLYLSFSLLLAVDASRWKINMHETPLFSIDLSLSLSLSLVLSLYPLSLTVQALGGLAEERLEGRRELGVNCEDKAGMESTRRAWRARQENRSVMNLHVYGTFRERFEGAENKPKATGGREWRTEKQRQATGDCYWRPVDRVTTAERQRVHACVRERKK